MPNYNKNKKEIVTKEKVVERVIDHSSLDLDSLTNSIVEAISSKINVSNNSVDTDTFDNSDTIGKLAEQMVVQRTGKDSNFNDLGSTVVTDKDSKEVDGTIDLLKDID